MSDESRSGIRKNSDGNLTSSATQLAWRIPVGRGRVSLRFALTQIAFATVVVGFLVIFLTPAEAHSGLLTATIVIALAFAALQAVRAWREASGPPNVWLDNAGLHWRDLAGREHVLSRTLARGYLIGHDVETRRDLTSLTLVLEGDFLSQPVELHPPADETRVRQWVRERWTLAEARPPAPQRLPLATYSEVALQQQFWLLEGRREELQALAQAWSKAAEWPLPPAGARPRLLECEFDGQPITLAISPHTWLDGHYFSASPETLRRLAAELTLQLSAEQPVEEFEIPLQTDSGHQWRIIFGVVKEQDAAEATLT